MNLVIKPDDLHQFDLGRIIGGMSWPGDKPGFAVVIGEERLPRAGSKSHHCHILADSYSMSKPDFLSSVGELQALYHTLAFYGRYEPQNIVHLYLHNSTTVRQGLSAIEFMSAPYSENGKVELYADMIIRRLSPVSKTLHLGQCDIVKHLNIAPDERSTADSKSHPAVAALGYAISIFELFEPDLHDEDENNPYQNDYVDPTTGY